MSAILAAAAIGYLLGSLPWGLLLTRLAGLGDVRRIGSGSIGATNVLRTGNKALAALTLTDPGELGDQPCSPALRLAIVLRENKQFDDAITIRSMVYLTLSYDHRAVDGAVAHQFMGHVKHTLENWTEPLF